MFFASDAPPRGPAPHAFARHARIALHLSAFAAVALALTIASDDIYPSSMQLQVSALVLKKVWMRTESAPGVLMVTDGDVARGYIDTPAATVLSLRNNSEDGFRLDFHLDPEVASSATVSGLPQPVRIGSEGATVTLPGRYRIARRFELHWRVWLASGIVPGTYPWPVQIEIEPN
ncbi:MAG: hypothetical protein KGL68_11885 [Burkholderiales bacterium]|nr:hypothetical protein [Burkholderiales bacterium]